MICTEDTDDFVWPTTAGNAAKLWVVVIDYHFCDESRRTPHMTHDDKPLTPAQARQKLQQGLADYLAGKGSEAIVFRLKRTKKASHTYPLKLTQQQRQTLLEHTNLSGKLKKKVEQAGEGTQVVPVTWNELNKLNDETSQAAYYARSPHKNRLMAVMSRVFKFFEEVEGPCST